MGAVEEWDDARLAALLPWPAPDANKYTRGVLAVVGGCARYPGAALLCAGAAQRAGAGYVRLAASREAVEAAHAWRPSLVAEPWDAWSPADLPAPRPGHPAAAVVGPGLDGADAQCARLAAAVLRGAEAPVLADGGALTALATGEGRQLAAERARDGRPLVVTPHAGEAARLARGARLDEAPDDPAALSAALARAYRCTCVLKGAVTYVSDGARVVRVARGTAVLAKAGTGDVLAGVIGALLAQGAAPLEAGVLGAALHAEAGRAAEERLTAICATPEDVAEALPEAVRRIAGA
ncbi:MAG: NAD(P)H-hydrate dehydratase [Eggerthellaceae bacterium]|nr:NAD(P)H-hydrate dehydratase [Eggerthellaceae bacterium]